MNKVYDLVGQPP